MDDQHPPERPAAGDGAGPASELGADGPPPPPPMPPAGTPPPAVPGAVGRPPGPGPTAARPPQRRRSRWPLVVALLAVVLLVPVALVLLAGADEDEAPAAAGSDTAAGEGEGADEPEEGTEQDAEEDADDPDARADGGDAGDGGADDDGATPDDGPGPGTVAPDAELAPLDLAALEGLDRIFGQLLTDIDASERVMIEFQAGLAEVLDGAASPEEALGGASEVAAEHRAALLVVRARLVDPLDEAGAERVRELYVAHLDAWEGFMAAVEDDPLAAFEQDERGSTVRINASADAFARALEAELPDDADAEVARFAEQVLDRGFRDMGYADV